MLNIHVDTDFGGDPDDFAAILMLLGLQNLQVSGITTVLDDSGHRAGAVNQVLSQAGRTGITVASGARKGLSSTTVAGIREEFWPEIQPVVASHPGQSLEMIENSLHRRAVLTLIGPHTNVAMLNKVLGTSLRGFRVVHMGGFIDEPADGYPKWTAADDFNIQFDPKATEVLYRTSADITMVPMPVAMQAWITGADVDRIARSGPLGERLAGQLRVWSADQNWAALGQTHDALPNDLAGIMWDPVTVLVAIGWQGAVIKQMNLKLVNENGIIRFVRDEEHGRAVDVVTAIDTDLFRTTFLEAIERAQLRLGS